MNKLKKQIFLILSLCILGVFTTNTTAHAIEEFNPKWFNASTTRVVSSKRDGSSQTVRITDGKTTLNFTNDMNNSYVGYGFNNCNSDVFMVQAFLRTRGYYSVLPDGIWGPKSHEALRKYQKSRKLNPDGICGPATWLQFNLETPLLK